MHNINNNGIIVCVLMHTIEPWKKHTSRGSANYKMKVKMSAANSAMTVISVNVENLTVIGTGPKAN